MPGGTVSSSAAMRSTPWSISIWPSQSCTADQLLSISCWAWTCWPHSRSDTGVGTDPRSPSRASERLCAGSVESTSVRNPAAAHRRAVHAATEVLPTPPLPV